MPTFSPFQKVNANINGNAKNDNNHICLIINDRSSYLLNACLFQVEQALEDQFVTGRVLAAVASRPGQSGRADGYVLEGKELEFYLRKIKAKKGK